MYVKAIKVKHIADYILEITFDNGDKGTIDFSQYAKRGGVFSGFVNIEYFKQVSIDPVWGVLCWPGEVDIAPERVYQLATGKSSDDCSESMTTEYKNI